MEIDLNLNKKEDCLTWIFVNINITENLTSPPDLSGREYRPGDFWILKLDFDFIQFAGLLAGLFQTIEKTDSFRGKFFYE